MGRIQSHGGVDELMERNGVVQGISYRTRSIVNAIHIRLDLVQESLWKFNPTTPTLPPLVPSMLLLVLPLHIKIPGTKNSEFHLFNYVFVSCNLM